MVSRILLVCLLTAAGIACVSGHRHERKPAAVVARKAGPPPHAPAHGYRHKHKAQHGAVELVFDTKLGVYVVVGWPGHYYRDGAFYRQINRRWHSSHRLDTGWVMIDTKTLPPGLARRGGRRRPHPAKHGY